jgi:hypothetical protein
LEDIGVAGRIILKCLFKKQDMGRGGDWINLVENKHE